MRIEWAIALCTLTAGTALAASGTTSKLEIHLHNDCKAIKEIRAVMQDRDDVEYNAKQDKDDPCHWTLDTNTDSFNTNLIHFSLRAFDPAARTGCKTTIWDEKGKVAMITFERFTPGRLVIITPNPVMKLPYTREIAGGDNLIACTETATLDSSRWTINGVAIDADEVLRLPFFEGAKDRCGVKVNSLRATKQSAKSGRQVELSRNDLVDALKAQRAGSSPCAVPTFSSAAIDISDKNLRNRGLQGLTLTVK